MIRLPRSVALFLTGISGLFGMRTPPEPEVIAQVAPAKGPEGRGPKGFAEPALQRGPAAPAAGVPEAHRVQPPGEPCAGSPESAAAGRRIVPRRRRGGQGF